MKEEQNKKDDIEGKKLLAGVVVELQEGNPEETLVDVVEINDEYEHLPKEPKLNEYGVVKDILSIGVRPIGALWQLELGELFSAVGVYMKPSLHNDIMIL